MFDYLYHAYIVAQYVYFYKYSKNVHNEKRQ